MTAFGWLRLNSPDADEVLLTVSRDETRASEVAEVANVVLFIDGTTFKLTPRQAQALARFLTQAARTP